MLAAHLIVTFNPPLEVFKNQLSAIDNLPAILVDNGSEQSTLSLLQSWVSEQPEIRKLIALGENRGIAAAQNRGIALARSLGCEYVLLLDHDSIPEKDLLKKLVEIAGEKLASNEKIAAVGARLIAPRSQRELGFAAMVNGVWRTQRCTKGDRLIPCEFLNSSGTLIYLPAWEKIGPFDERFFIDHVETDWCMRVKAKGFRVFGSCRGVLQHHMGDAIVKFWCFGWRTMPRRSPRRHFTIVRNSLWLYRRSYVPLVWKFNNFAKLMFTLFYFSLFDKERSSQLYFILRGFYKGLFNYPGPLHSD